MNTKVNTTSHSCGYCHTARTTGNGQVEGVRLLVWDAPNIDMVIASLVGGKPNSEQRPDMRVLIDWLTSRAEPGEVIEACVFVNVASSNRNGLQGWVFYLVEEGFRVFAKPKHNGEGDIDPDMLAHINQHLNGSGPELREVIVASHDAANFTGPLERLAGESFDITVLALPERAGSLPTIPDVQVVDLEEIPGLIASPLPRIHHLPRQGRWLDPILPIVATGGNSRQADLSQTITSDISRVSDVSTS